MTDQAATENPVAAEEVVQVEGPLRKPVLDPAKPMILVHPVVTRIDLLQDRMEIEMNVPAEPNVQLEIMDRLEVVPREHVPRATVHAEMMTVHTHVNLLLPDQIEKNVHTPQEVKKAVIAKEDPIPLVEKIAVTVKNDLTLLVAQKATIAKEEPVNAVVHHSKKRNTEQELASHTANVAMMTNVAQADPTTPTAEGQEVLTAKRKKRKNFQNFPMVPSV
jgi:hypothetical protein